MNIKRNFNWEQLRITLETKASFEDLSEYVKKNPIPFLDCHVDQTLSEHDRDQLDLVALHYKPADAPQDLNPCKIGGDGNCFLRTLSFICFHDESMHTEMRVRLVYEGVMNAKYYLNNRYLSRGANIIYRRAGPCKQLVMYSPVYIGQEEVNVEEIYKNEVPKVTRDAEYCGLWQLCQAANILHRPVVSVYPNGLHDGMRLDFNRKFMCIESKYNDKNPAYIMWTPMQVTRNSYPVHFVPLLKAVSGNVQIYVKYVKKLNNCYICVTFVFIFYIFRRISIPSVVAQVSNRGHGRGPICGRSTRKTPLQETPEIIIDDD